MTHLDFYKGKTALVTGHSGFKGAWLSKILINAGAHVVGYSLTPPTTPSLFDILGLDTDMLSITGDIRDLAHLKKVFADNNPEIVFHLAAQPIVRDSYTDPVYTYETNIMGTVNVCECIRLTPSVKSFVNITTDKVYQNNEWEWGYRETDTLNGYDPYSNSKSCSELVTQCYINSFFQHSDVAVSTARAGNVIGGGDFANDRIIPDCIRAAKQGIDISVRNPSSTRPFQHVIEPLYVYLMIAAKQYENKKYAGFYNVGPDESDCITTAELVSLFCQEWGNNIRWQHTGNNGPHEANFLKLDCSKLKRVFGWHPRWHIEQAIQETVSWYRAYLSGADMSTFTINQINKFYNKEIK